MNYKRADRVANQIRAEVAVILAREVRDPRLGLLTITDVRLTDDLRIAKIYLVEMGGKALSIETQQGLGRAKSFIRKQLSQRVELRYIPDLCFFSDDTFVHGARIEEIFADIRQREETDTTDNS